MARCLRCNAGNEWIEGTVIKSAPLSEPEQVYLDNAVLQRQLAEAKAEIEAMRPMVEACRARYEHHQNYQTYECQCITCQWYRDYLERKQP